MNQNKKTFDLFIIRLFDENILLKIKESIDYLIIKI